MLKKLFPYTLVIFLICNYAMSQRKVSGIVTDSTGLPIPGVNVILKGTTTVTSTDFEGKYSLEVSNSNSIFVFSYLGYSNSEVLLKDDQTILNIMLHQDDALINEVVTVGYVKYKYDYKPKKNYVTVRVFFASDRNLTGSKDVNEIFGAERSNINYGISEVSIPRVHKTGELEKPSVWKFEFHDDPEKHITLLNVEVKSQDYFFINLNKKIKQSPKKNAFIFVHGYNVSFEDAVKRTAQMSYDLSFDGAPVLYSWPSQAKTINYISDGGNMDLSETHLKIFLENFLSTSSAQNIYLIAHSMGNKGLTKALASIISENPNLTKHIKEIILAAPDIDADIFKQNIAPKLIQCNKPITLYASSRPDRPFFRRL